MLQANKGMILKLAVAGVLVYWLVRSRLLDLAALKSVLAQPGLVMAALVLVGITLLICNFRWLLLVRSQGLEASFWGLMPLTLVGIFFSYVIPGSVGGDLVKSYYIAKRSPGLRVRAVTTVIMDRVLGLFAMLCMAALIGFLELGRIQASKDLSHIFYIFLFVILVFLGSFTFLLIFRWAEPLLPRRLREWPVFEKLTEAVTSYRDRKRLLLLGVFLSGLSHLCYVAIFILVGSVLGESHIPLGAHFFVVPLGLAITAIPISPAGVGVGQVAMMFLYRLYTGESDLQVGQVASTVVQMFQLVWGLAGAYFYVKLGEPKPSAAE